MRLHLPVTFKQGAQHARHQHPGFASASASLDRDTAARIAGDGVKGFGRHLLAIVLIAGVHWIHRSGRRARPPKARPAPSESKELHAVSEREDGIPEPGPRDWLCQTAGAAAHLGSRELHTMSERGGDSFEQGPRNRLCQAAGAAAPSGGSALREARSVGALFTPEVLPAQPARRAIVAGLALTQRRQRCTG